MKLTQSEENRFFALEDKGQSCTSEENDEFQVLLDKYYDQELKTYQNVFGQLGIIF